MYKYYDEVLQKNQYDETSAPVTAQFFFYPRTFGELFSERDTLTFDDAWDIVNRDKRDRNIANSTRAEQMTQMKNVREMPATSAGANSQQKTIAVDDNVFNHLLSEDGDVDNLFG